MHDGCPVSSTLFLACSVWKHIFKLEKKVVKITTDTLQHVNFFYVYLTLFMSHSNPGALFLVSVSHSLCLSQTTIRRPLEKCQPGLHWHSTLVPSSYVEPREERAVTAGQWWHWEYSNTRHAWVRHVRIWRVIQLSRGSFQNRYKQETRVLVNYKLNIVGDVR